MLPLSVSLPGKTGGFPRQCVHWLGMTENPCRLAERDGRWSSKRFCHKRRFGIAGILCVFQGSGSAESGRKSRCSAGKRVQASARKKGSGANLFAPHHSSRFRIERSSAVGYPNFVRSGGQNLAALCTAAGQNLAAVSGSHSLTETVDLGTMTIAGLVGTLHLDTPPNNNSYARQSYDRSNTYFLTIIGHARVL